MRRSLSNSGLVVAAFALLVAPAMAIEPTAADTAFFESKVRPLLVKRCYDCHSNDGEHEGDLFLDSRAGWSVGGESGPAVVPGRPDDSLLVRAVRRAGPEMPPDETLPADEIAVLVEWIRRGAPDPRVGPGAPSVKKGIDVEAGRMHWAFQPLAKVEVPTVRDTAWPRTDVDRYMLARLEAAGIRPAADADPVTLLRRASFDLIGLPPSAEDVKSSEPFAALVDRLLVSGHFGERWGRHWLDVARFAEADGHFFPEAWRFRDYVIDALNDDRPFDEFLIEQIAGDLLPAATPTERERRTIATGFLALGPNFFPRTETGNYLDVLDEQIDALTRSMLGLTVSCARCHDHKFDPIPTADYYALAGILASSEIRKTAVYARGKHTFLGTSHGLPLAGFRPEPVARWSELVEQSYLDGHAVVHLGWDVNALVKQRAAASTAEQTSLDAKIAKLRAEIARRQAAGSAARQALRRSPPLPPMAMGVIDRASPTDLRIHLRGEADNLGAEVPRGVVQIATSGEPPAIGPGESGRLQLARWIADPKNPLTARVAANRIWLHLFGEGLVRTPDDFGTMGERPSHPELLDFLARKFIDDGWSVKRMIRELMLSRTYGLSVARDTAADEIDADNRLLWRHARRRLETEAIRDALLAFSGELDLKPPAGSLIGDHGPGALRYDADVLHFDGVKRSIYLPQPRGKLPPLYQLFDHTDLALVTGRRDVTTVPLQALFMLNSAWVRERADAAAARLLSDAALDDDARITLAFRRAFARSPTPADMQTARRFLSESESEIGRPAAWASFCQLLMAAPEFIYVH
jgi:hypothetical protein